MDAAKPPTNRSIRPGLRQLHRRGDFREHRPSRELTKPCEGTHDREGAGRTRPKVEELTQQLGQRSGGSDDTQPPRYSQIPRPVVETRRPGPGRRDRPGLRRWVEKTPATETARSPHYPHLLGTATRCACTRCPGQLTLVVLYSTRRGDLRQLEASRRMEKTAAASGRRADGLRSQRMHPRPHTALTASPPDAGAGTVPDADERRGRWTLHWTPGGLAGQPPYLDANGTVSAIPTCGQNNDSRRPPAKADGCLCAPTNRPEP